MLCKKQFPILSVNASRASTAALAMAVVLTLTILCTKSAQGQTYRVIYNFIGGTAGYAPKAGLTMDAAGNLYGTTSDNYSFDRPLSPMGTAFRLTTKGTDWVFSQLYRFGSPGDGASPNAGVVFGPDGNFYGTTYVGGASGFGTVFSLSSR